MSNKPNSVNEEVDLGSLFSQIGKAFSSFFSSVARLFKYVFHAIILFLLFLRKNIIPLGAATILGVLIGIFMQKNKNDIYVSSMTVQANHKSAQKLYKDLDYINALLSEKDSIKLSELLNTSPSETMKLRGFNIEPVDANKQLLLGYDSFMRRTDTIYTRGFTFDDYTQRISVEDIRYHQINVESTDPGIFSKLQDGILNLVSNDYYVQLHKSKINELKFKKEELLENIAQLDSIRKRYKEVALMKAKNGAVSADVSFSNTSKSERNYDMDLYHMSLKLMKELDEVNTDIQNNDKLIDVESDFKYGTLKKGIASKAWFKYGLLGFLLALFVLVALRVNTYLTDYEKSIQ